MKRRLYHLANLTTEFIKSQFNQPIVANPLAGFHQLEERTLDDRVDAVWKLFFNDTKDSDYPEEGFGYFLASQQS